MSDASALIDARIAELADWRGRTLAHVRALIHAADPAVVEEWKWRGTPVWSHDGILCTETYKAVVKLTFAHGAALPDPTGLFNASLEGNTHRYPRNRRAGRARLHDPDPGRRRPERSEADKGLTAMTLRWIIPLALALALSSCSAARIDGSTRQFSGVWLYEFEGSTFIEGAARPPTRRPAYRATDWLEYPPDLPRLGEQVEALGYDADQDCHPVQPFLITFIGHRTRRLGGSGHMGLWHAEVTPHRTLSIKRLGGPMCYGG